jgi:hypothetical protein
MLKVNIPKGAVIWVYKDDYVIWEGSGRVNCRLSTGIYGGSLEMLEALGVQILRNEKFPIRNCRMVSCGKHEDKPGLHPEVAKFYASLYYGDNESAIGFLPKIEELEISPY